MTSAGGTSGPSRSNAIGGILVMMAAVGLLTAMNGVIKLIGPEYHPAQVTFLRNIIAAMVILPFILKTGGVKTLKTRRPGMHAARALSGFLANVFYFYAAARLPLSDVMVISQAVPLFVALMAVVFLREAVGWRRWAAIVAGFGGVLVTLEPTGEIHPAALATVAGTVCWATTILLLRTLGRTESPYTVVFYYMIAGTLVASLAQPWVWKTPGEDVMVLFVVVGIFGAFGQLLMTVALKMAEASVVSPFSYTAILWGIGFDLVIWHAAPDTATLLGAAIITLSGLYLLHRENMKRRARSKT